MQIAVDRRLNHSLHGCPRKLLDVVDNVEPKLILVEMGRFFEFSFFVLIHNENVSVCQLHLAHLQCPHRMIRFAIWSNYTHKDHETVLGTPNVNVNNYHEKIFLNKREKTPQAHDNALRVVLSRSLTSMVSV